MSAIAIVMMILFILVLWGGWSAAFYHLVRTPDLGKEDLADAKPSGLVKS